MEQIAFFINGYCVHWRSVVILFSAVGAICIFLSLYLKRTDNYIAALTLIPSAVLFSLILSRILYIYGYGQIEVTGLSGFLSGFGSYATLSILGCCLPITSLLYAVMFAIGYVPVEYGLIGNIFGNLAGISANNGFVLLGVFLGCFLAVMLTKTMGVYKNVPMVLDCMSIAGSAGIAAGRLAELFGSGNRGQLIKSVLFSIWAQPVANPLTGVIESRFSTFLMQSAISGMLFVGLLLFYNNSTRKKDGDTTLLFLLFYCSSQFILDSTRYDSMKLRSNGFISVVQVLSMLAFIAVIVLIFVRLVKMRGFKMWYLPLWGIDAILIGCAGYMEYFVQRYRNEAGLAYNVMCLTLGLVTITASCAFFSHLKENPYGTGLSGEQG